MLFWLLIFDSFLLLIFLIVYLFLLFVLSFFFVFLHLWWGIWPSIADLTCWSIVLFFLGVVINGLFVISVNICYGFQVICKFKFLLRWIGILLHESYWMIFLLVFLFFPTLQYRWWSYFCLIALYIGNTWMWTAHFSFLFFISSSEFLMFSPKGIFWQVANNCILTLTTL